MRVFVICLFMVLVSIPAHADDFFQDSEINDLRVLEVDSDEGWAWVRDTDGNEAEIFVGDRIGSDLRTVTKIDNISITVRLGKELTKMPAYAFENVEIVEGESEGGH
ncbi:MAG: hypothetical protein JRG69_13735 [Deltaproteobacteria bacterium]|nr:hypothetical protein [Deltaproteobacteria bacterium]